MRMYVSIDMDIRTTNFVLLLFLLHLYTGHIYGLPLLILQIWVCFFFSYWC